MNHHPAAREGFGPAAETHGAPATRLSSLAPAWTPFLVGLAALLSIGCGVQGPPKPPRIEQPQAAKDLTVLQVGRSLRFTFSLPQLATDGERLTKPLEVEFLRGTLPSSQTSPPPAPALSPWIALSAPETEKQKRGEKLVFSAQLAEEDLHDPGRSTLILAVRTLTRGFRRRAIESELSNRVPVRLLRVAAPVKGLQARVTEHAIEVSWTAPETAVTSYRIYRKGADASAGFLLRAEARGAAWQDTEFQFGRTYSYRVTALVKEGSSVAESEDSQAIEITPKDTFPPAAPKELTALYTGQSVEILWTANSEPDLGGYNLYRREAAGTFHKLNSELLVTPVYRDTSVVAGQSYTYRATAVDLAGNESLPSDDVAVEAN